MTDGIFFCGRSTGQGSVQIMANPNRNGRGGPPHGRGGYSNGRSGGGQGDHDRPVPSSTTEHVGANSGASASENGTSPPRLNRNGKGVERHGSHPHPPYAGRGLARGGPRGGYALRGRGGFGGGLGFERGRGGFRGRGRGAMVPVSP